MVTDTEPKAEGIEVEQSPQAEVPQPEVQPVPKSPEAKITVSPDERYQQLLTKYNELQKAHHKVISRPASYVAPELVVMTQALADMKLDLAALHDKLDGVSEEEPVKPKSRYKEELEKREKGRQSTEQEEAQRQWVEYCNRISSEMTEVISEADMTWEDPRLNEIKDVWGKGDITGAQAKLTRVIAKIRKEDLTKLEETAVKKAEDMYKRKIIAEGFLDTDSGTAGTNLTEFQQIEKGYIAGIVSRDKYMEARKKQGL